MGACLHCERFDGVLSANELTKRYNAIRDEMCDMYGSNPYNGTWSTLEPGLSIQPEVFNSYEAAYKHIDERAQKWDRAMAVRFYDRRQETIVEPTFSGLKANDLLRCRPIIVGTGRLRCAVELTAGGPPVTQAAADQLSPATQRRLLAAVHNWSAKHKLVQSLCQQLRDFSHKLLADSPTDLTAAEFTAAKRTRKQLEKLLVARNKAAEKLLALDSKHADKLYAAATVDHGAAWLVGGLCAE